MRGLGFCGYVRIGVSNPGSWSFRDDVNFLDSNSSCKSVIMGSVERAGNRLRQRLFYAGFGAFAGMTKAGETAAVLDD